MKTTSPKRILAVDPGMQHLGVAILDGEDLIWYGVKTFPNSALVPGVRSQMRQYLTTLLQRHRPTVLVVEEPFYAQSLLSDNLKKLTNDIKTWGKWKGLAVRAYTPPVVKAFFCRDQRTKCSASRNRASASPNMLLSAELSPDEGYFKERLAAGRNQVVGAWRERSSQLAPRSRETDLLGVLAVASQLFQQDGRRNILVIFSDMRQYTAALDLERPNSIAVASAMAAVEKRRLIPNLKDVEVYVLGADGAGKSISYWQGLRDFWQVYFKKAGANVRSYTLVREVPALQ